MTVADLIEILRTVDQTLEVRLADWSEQYCSPELFDENEVRVVEKSIDVHNDDGSFSHYETRRFLQLGINGDDHL